MSYNPQDIRLSWLAGNTILCHPLLICPKCDSYWCDSQYWVYQIWTIFQRRSLKGIILREALIHTLPPSRLELSLSFFPIILHPFVSLSSSSCVASQPSVCGLFTFSSVTTFINVDGEMCFLSYWFSVFMPILSFPMRFDFVRTAYT